PMVRIRSLCCACATNGIAAAPPTKLMKSRRLIASPRGSGQGIVAAQTCAGEGPINVRFGSKADMCGAREHVRFTPNSDHKSRHAALVMSALHLKADMCGANRHVCFGPIADIGFAQLFQCACRPKMRNCRDK